MPTPTTKWEGFVVRAYDEGVVPVVIYHDEWSGTYAYIDGDLADDISDAEGLADNYGDEFYSSLSDYRNGLEHFTAEEVWGDDV